MGQSLPEECSPPGEADDCAIIVSLSEKTILGEAHNFQVLSSGGFGNCCISWSCTAKLGSIGVQLWMDFASPA